MERRGAAVVHVSAIGGEHQQTQDSVVFSDEMEKHPFCIRDKAKELRQRRANLGRSASYRNKYTETIRRKNLPKPAGW